MTTPVRIQQRIGQLEGQGLSHARIARELGVSRTTVIKYAARDCSPSSAVGRRRPGRGAVPDDGRVREGGRRVADLGPASAAQAEAYRAPRARAAGG